nr:DNA-binding WRKY [Ipomoea batatas]
MLKREGLKYRAHVKRHDDVQGIYSVALEGDFNISGQPNYFAINISLRSCTCGHWAVDRLPCVHAHAACHYVGTVADGMVSEKYSLTNYILSYEGTIMPLLQQAYWPAAQYKLNPPADTTPASRPGRRRTTRIPNEMDLNDRRCGHCRSANHDIRNCTRFNNSR